VQQFRSTADAAAPLLVLLVVGGEDRPATPATTPGGVGSARTLGIGAAVEV
jgi:hypothetical protein